MLVIIINDKINDIKNTHKNYIILEHEFKFYMTKGIALSLNIKV